MEREVTVQSLCVMRALDPGLLDGWHSIPFGLQLERFFADDV
jgi:hypothetical protein